MLNSMLSFRFEASGAAARASWQERLCRPGFISLCLALVTLAVYLPTAWNDFVNYDDSDYVTENAHVKAGLKWETVVWAFKSGHASNWHPLTWLSHALDCQVFGMKPGAMHLVSAGFHVANTVLLFLVLRALTGAFWRSALVAALFGLHPLHVESVAWVSERKDVLSGLFFLLTIWAYGRYANAECQMTNDECQRPGSGGRQTPDHDPRNTAPASRFTFHVSLLLPALPALFRARSHEQADARDDAFRPAATGLLAVAPPPTRDSRPRTQDSFHASAGEGPVFRVERGIEHRDVSRAKRRRGGFDRPDRRGAGCQCGGILWALHQEDVLAG